MSEEWDYQIRLTLEDEAARIARRDPTDPSLGALPDILARHDARLKCQFDAFSDFLAAAEAEGNDDTALYRWTKATIENPAKEAKYIKSFTLYVGGAEVYTKDRADPLEADLKPLVGGGLVTGLSKHDTNPANNPQAPAKYRD